MINFTLGPVANFESVLDIAAKNPPYFRTSEFSKVMMENEQGILECLKADKGSKAVFLTCSGTGAMESAVLNCLSPKDKILIINGGSFGQRFVDICNAYNYTYEEIILGVGEPLTQEKLGKYENKGYTALLVNMCETSTGVLYDGKMIGQFCKRNGMFYICDNISSFLADPFDMKGFCADVVITSSQKALACSPGISIIAMSPSAVERVVTNQSQTFYLNLRYALSNQDRGQTPFTPAVTVLLQINKRFDDIRKTGGVDKEIERVKNLADDFRKKIINMPFEFTTSNPSNALTGIHPTTYRAYDLFSILEKEYDIWVCPNGGNLTDYMFRVGHIGALTIEDNDTLINAIKDMQTRGII